MIDKVALFLWHVLQSQMIAKQRESVAIALLPALSSKHSNSLMKPCGSFYHPVCWPRGRQIKIEEREEGLREREKGENNQRRKDKKNIEGVQKMRVVGAQVRRNK